MTKAEKKLATNLFAHALIRALAEHDTEAYNALMAAVGANIERYVRALNEKDDDAYLAAMADIDIDIQRLVYDLAGMGSVLADLYASEVGVSTATVLDKLVDSIANEAES